MRSLLPPDMAMQGPCSCIDSLRNSITLWKEQEMLVDRMGPKIRAIHRSRNVSHFHESWMECAIVDRLCLWSVCLTPLSPFPLLLPLFSYLNCVAPTVCSAELVCICVGENHPWPGLAATSTAIKGEKKMENRTPLLHPFNVYPQPTICKGLSLWCQCYEMISM